VTHSGDRFSLETEYQTKDGLIPVEVVINYLQYGDQVYHCAFARDITERKRAEEAQDRLTTLVESTTELVAIMDPEERLIYLNKAGREMLGLAPEEDVTTYHLSDFYPEWAKALVSEVGIPTALEEDFWSGESAILAQGYQMPVLQSIMVQRKANGTVDYLSTIIRDISEIKMAEEEREQLLADLEAHASKLQTASEVAQAATSILDPEELFPQVVELVRERFDYYYVGIFDIDETGQWAVLRAGTGEAGQKMLADGHRLAIGGQSMIGASIQMREARVAFDVGIEAVRFDNPVLPDTRSEMALPLQSHDQVLGAMTIQSVRPSDFSAADIIVLQTVADQLANAIYNVTLLRQREQALQELERAYGRYTRDAWRTYLEEMRRVQSYRYRNRRIETEAIPHPEARETLESGKSVVTQVRAASQESGDASTLASEGTDGDRGGLAVPIELRGQTLGVLNLRFAGEEISEDMREVVEDVAGRLGQALENARLLNRTRADAVRDQLLSEVTSEVRQTLDMETVLKTAAQEIRRALDLPEVVIRLGGTSDLGSQEDQ
jgi:PAS domain S-box-containing protein